MGFQVSTLDSSKTLVEDDTYVQTSHLATCFDRWADAQWDGTLQAIDEGIEFMVSLSKAMAQSRPHDIREDAMDDLEAAAYAVTDELRKILALDPARVAILPFDPGRLLCKTVEQYLLYLPKGARQTITAGANLTCRCRLGVLEPDELSEAEFFYREWVTPHLMRHLIYPWPPYAQE